jgi:hypothetical protein
LHVLLVASVGAGIIGDAALPDETAVDQVRDVVCAGDARGEAAAGGASVSVDGGVGVRLGTGVGERRKFARAAPLAPTGDATGLLKSAVAVAGGILAGDVGRGVGDIRHVLASAPLLMAALAHWKAQRKQDLVLMPTQSVSTLHDSS